MDYEKEIGRRDKRIEAYKKEVSELCEEIVAMRQLLDCAAANLVLALADGGKPRSLSKEDVKNALGKYHLSAREEDGYYILEITEE